MGGYRRHVARLLPAVFLLLLLALAAACTTGDPQNTLAPAGDVARKIRDLFNIVLWPLIGIFFVVEGLLVFALLRFRRRHGQEMPKQVHGNPRLEVGWTIAPALFLFVLAIPIILTIIDLAEVPTDQGEPLEVEVTARQWSWSFKYPDFGVTTTNEMYIPVGRTIKVSVRSPDVIHSFWVPKLAGKIDVIPSRVNEMWFNATDPGTYSGQCAEFCGLAHWTMRFTLIAMPEEEFQAWLEEQQASRPGSDEPRLTWQVRE